MGAHCSIDCYVRNPKGEVVESNLFKDLLHYFPKQRSLAKELYGTATDSEFTEAVREKAKFDENGEITFNSLRKLMDLDISKESILNSENKRIKAGSYSYNDAISKIDNYNKTSQYNDAFMAILMPSSERPGRYDVSVVERTAVQEATLERVIEDKTLIDEIITSLRNKGVSVDFLEEGEREYQGRYSTMNARKTASGLHALIEVSKGKTLTEALAEEAGHFAFGALGKNPLAERLTKVLQDKEVRKAILGNEYDTKNMGTDEIRETAGTLIGRALMNKEHSKSAWSRLASKIADIAKRIFASFTGDEVLKARLSAENIAKSIARNFMSDNYQGDVENALAYREELYSDTAINGETFRNVIDKLNVALAQLKSLGSDDFSDNFKETVKAIISGRTKYLSADDSSMFSTFSLTGIAEAMSLLSDKIGDGKEVSELLNSIDFLNDEDFYNNMPENAKKLRQVRIYNDACAAIISDLNDVIEGFGSKKLSGGYNVNITDSRGIAHTVNLKDLHNQLISVQSQLLKGLETREREFFIRFCEDMLGSKFVHRSARMIWNITKNQKRRISDSERREGESLEAFKERKNKWIFGVKERDYTVDELLTSLQTDISLFDRFLNSMSNNPDVIGQILDKASKMANKIADDRTNSIHEELMLLDTRFRKIKGVKLEDLYEKDDEGNFTGNIISDLKWGEWEREWKEMYDNARNAFKTEPGYDELSELERTMRWEAYFKDILRDWHEENSMYSEELERWIPSPSKRDEKYANHEFVSLMDSNAELKAWYDDYMKLKTTIDKSLPEKSTTHVRLPQFKGSFINIAGNFQGRKLSQLGTALRARLVDTFCESSEDTDYGSDMTYNTEEEMLHENAVAYEKERINRLPLYGIRKLKNMRELSTDLLGSTLAYAGMAFSYEAMSRIADTALVGKEVLRGRPTKEKGLIVKKGETNHAFGRYSKFIDKQIFGISSRRHHLIGKWLLDKTLAFISRTGTFWFLGGNVVGGIVNTGTGVIELLKEAAVGENLNFKDFMWAHKAYFKDFLPNALNYGAEFKHDKTSLLVRHFNTVGNNKLDQREWHTQNRALTRIFNMMGRSIYAPYSTGDHYMQTISYLANARGTKLWHNGDTETSLYSALIKVSVVGAKLRELLEDSEEVLSRKLKGESLFDKSVLSNEEDYQKFIDLNNIVNKLKDLKVKKLSDLSLTDEEKELLKNRNLKDMGSKKATIEAIIKDADSMLSYKYMIGKQTPMTLRMEGTYFKSAEGKEEYNKIADLIDKIESAGNLDILTADEENYIKNEKKIKTIGKVSDVVFNLKQAQEKLIWTTADESAFMDKTRETSNRMHGIYNNQDKTNLHGNLYGRMLLSMKGYALGMIERRFSASKYNVALGHEVEGSVNSFMKMMATSDLGYGIRSLAILNMFTGIGTKTISKAMKEAGFTDNQIANIKRNKYDTMAQTLLIILGYLLGTLKPEGSYIDDDDNMFISNDYDTWMGRLYYLVNRWTLEQMAFNSITGFYNESVTLADLMPPGTAAVADIVRLAFYETPGAWIYDEDDDRFYYQSDSSNGKYNEGDSRAMIHFIRNFPYLRSLYTINHPWNAWENYEYGRKLRRR